MLKGLFTPPQDEEHLTRDALREESLPEHPEGDDDGSSLLITFLIRSI